MQEHTSFTKAIIEPLGDLEDARKRLRQAAHPFAQRSREAVHPLAPSAGIELGELRELWSQVRTLQIWKAM
jgi:hypothetical protein